MTPALQYDCPSHAVGSIGSSARQGWKTGRQRGAKPHLDDDIFKEMWGHLQGKLTMGFSHSGRSANVPWPVLQLLDRRQGGHQDGFWILK